MSAPPPPPAPPGGGEFTSRQATPTKSKAPTPTGAAKAPVPPAGKAAAAAATPSRTPSPPTGSKQTPPARAQSPASKQPQAAAAKGTPPPPPAAAGTKAAGAPPAGAAPAKTAAAPPVAAVPKKVPPAPSSAAANTSPAKTTPGKQSPAKRAPTPEAGKQTSAPSAVPPVAPSKKAPTPTGQPPLAPGAARAPSPKKGPPPQPTATKEPAPPASSASADAAPPTPAAAKKSPAGKRSPARGVTPPSKKSAADATTPAPHDSGTTPTATPTADAPPPAAAATPARPASGPPTASQPAAGSPPPQSYTRHDAQQHTPAATPGPGVSPIAPQQYSPPPALSQSNIMSQQSNIAAPGSRRMPSARRPAAGRANQGVLDRDPRSGLPLIAFPADRQASLAHLGNDILLHFFEDCDRISSKGKPLRRILLVTDQTLFLCDQNGSLMRCVQVSKISQVNVAMDNSNEIALVVPSEYDIIMRFDRRSQRDDILTVLRAVHKRMVSAELSVWHVKDVRPNQYRMEKPPGFQLQRIPQRSRANLSKALESIDASDRERRIAIQRVQEQLDYEHRQEALDKQQETSVVQAKLDEASTRLRMQLEEIDKLRQAFAKIQRRVEEIDAQYGNSGDISATKDMKIRELHEVVEALTSSVTKANEERMRLDKLRRAGDFDEKDLDFVESDVPRLRGRSLHHQGLVEVLQRQLMEKQRELADLQSKQIDLQKLNLDLRKKEENLRELEQTVVTTSSFKDPNSMYSTAAQGGLEDLLRGAPSSPGSPGTRGGASSMFGSPSMLLDDIARNRGAASGDDEVLLSRGALSPPKQIFSTDIPEFRVPPDERDFKEDPRTSLRFKDLEGPFVDKFPSLQGAIMYFFAVGTKENKRGQSQKRVLIVTDQVVYQCTTGGAINRTFEIKDIREFIRDRDNQVALVVEGLNEYDLLMKFKDAPEVCQELLEVLQKTSAYNKRHPPLVVKEVETISASELRLEKPPTWEYVDRRARPRRGLYRALQQLSKTSASERMRANVQQDELRRDLTNRIREELLPEVNIRREREYVRLRQQLVTTQTLLQEKQLEARNLLRQIQTHKCSIRGVAVQQSAASLSTYDAQGMYWIPTDPVVMEAEHEILHIQFSNNFVVTSHPNGFINVWDITSADLVRCLKINGHTARVTTFFFEAYQVLSGGHDSSLRLWHVMQPTPQFVVHNAHRGAITGVQFDGAVAVSSGTDGVLHVWDFTPTSLKHNRVLKAHNSAIVGFRLERGYVASAEWGWIFLWDIAKGIVIRTLRDENGGITCIDLCGNRIVTGGTSGVLNVWNTTTGEAEPLHGHADDVHCVSLKGTFAVSSSADGTVRMWDAKTCGDLGVFHDCFPQEVKSFFFRSNRFVVGEGTTIKCWTR